MASLTHPFCGRCGCAHDVQLACVSNLEAAYRRLNMPEQNVAQRRAAERAAEIAAEIAEQDAARDRRAVVRASSPVGEICNLCEVSGAWAAAVVVRFGEPRCGSCAARIPDGAGNLLALRQTHAAEELVRILGQRTYAAPCRRCGCERVPHEADACPVCFHPKETR